jgi:hypothetical protein
MLLQPAYTAHMRLCLPASVRHFAVNAGSNTIKLVCERTSGTGNIDIFRSQLSQLSQLTDRYLHTIGPAWHMNRGNRKSEKYKQRLNINRVCPFDILMCLEFQNRKSLHEKNYLINGSQSINDSDVGFNTHDLTCMV